MNLFAEMNIDVIYNSRKRCACGKIVRWKYIAFRRDRTLNVLVPGRNQFHFNRTLPVKKHSHHKGDNYRPGYHEMRAP